MSLEGTLETIALPDVLALLSVTAKTGELRVHADGVKGSLWLDAGRVSGFDVGKNKTPVDALFALLRMREGTFRFHTDGHPMNPVEPLEVGPVLEQAESRLLEWPSIVSVVPSLAAAVKLHPAVSEPVVLEPRQWRMVASVGSGCAVAAVIEASELGEFDGCKAVKELVDLKLAEVVPSEEPSLPVCQSVPAGQSLLEAGQADFEAEAFPSPSDDLAPADGGAIAGAGEAAGTGFAWQQDVQHGSGHDVDLPTEAGQLGRPGEALDGAEAAEGPAVDFSDDVWREEGESSEEAEVMAPAVAEPHGDPVNRGLLLKFLGSARN